MRRITASATSVTTSALRVRFAFRPPIEPRAPSRRPVGRVVARAVPARGRRRTPTPVASETAPVNATTRQSRPGLRQRGQRGRQHQREQPAEHPPRDDEPARPASTASTRLSTSCWVHERPDRAAPSAERTHSSRCRTDARTSSRFATLAQAMSSTNPTAVSSASSAGRTEPTSCSRSEITRTVQPAFDRGASRAMSAAIAARSASAAPPWRSRPASGVR